jgi:hypothetical protein
MTSDKGHVMAQYEGRGSGIPNGDAVNDNALEPIILEEDGPFLLPRSRVLSVSVTDDDVILRLATIDEKVVEVPIAIGALPDLAMGVAAALRMLKPEG